MTVAQRRAHLVAWIAMSIVIALTLVWSLTLRARMPVAHGASHTPEAHP